MQLLYLPLLLRVRDSNAEVCSQHHDKQSFAIPLLPAFDEKCRSRTQQPTDICLFSFLLIGLVPPVGFEPTASLILSQSGLPVAYRGMVVLVFVRVRLALLPATDSNSNKVFRVISERTGARGELGSRAQLVFPGPGFFLSNNSVAPPEECIPHPSHLPMVSVFRNQRPMCAGGPIRTDAYLVPNQELLPLSYSHLSCSQYLCTVLYSRSSQR